MQSPGWPGMGERVAQKTIQTSRRSLLRMVFFRVDEVMGGYGPGSGFPSTLSAENNVFRLGTWVPTTLRGAGAASLQSMRRHGIVG